MSCRDWVNNLKFTQGEYRFEVELNGQNNQFLFGITQNQPNSTNVVFPTENRLALQDSICVNEYGLFVSKPSSRTDVNFPLYTYGNTQAFSAAVAASLDGTLYSNGSLQIKANNDVLVPYRGLFNHLYRPQTQQTDTAGQPGSPKDQLRGAEDGMITAEPNIMLIGSKNYQILLNLAAAMTGTFTFERAVLIVRGVVAQNSTVVS